MSNIAQQENDAKLEKNAKRAFYTTVILACANLSISAVFTFASLYSDCFGIGDFFKNPLPYIGFFDALIVAGFILGLAPLIFMRFAAFTISGFSLYCGWCAGEFNSSFLPALISCGYGIVALSHFAVGVLSFRQSATLATIVGLAGLACWTQPITLAINNF